MAECKDDFNYYRTDRGSVLLVTREDGQGTGHGSDRNDTGTVLRFYMNIGVPRMYWNRMEQSVDNWHVFDENNHPFPISYCLSLRVPYCCRLQVHVWLLVTVVILNTIKFACMLLSLIEQRGTPMVTVGDAVASFFTNKMQTFREIIFALRARLEQPLRGEKKMWGGP